MDCSGRRPIPKARKLNGLCSKPDSTGAIFRATVHCRLFDHLPRPRHRQLAFANTGRLLKSICTASEAIANDEDLPDELAYAVMKKIADKSSS